MSVIIPYALRRLLLRRSGGYDRQSRKGISAIPTSLIGSFMATAGTASVIVPAAVAYIAFDQSRLRQDAILQIDEIKHLEKCMYGTAGHIRIAEAAATTYINRLERAASRLSQQDKSITLEALRNLHDLPSESGLSYRGMRQSIQRLLVLPEEVARPARNLLLSADELDDYIQWLSSRSNNEITPLTMRAASTHAVDKKLPDSISELRLVDSIDELPILDLPEALADGAYISDSIKGRITKLKIELARIEIAAGAFQIAVAEEIIIFAEELNGWSYTPFTLRLASSCIEQPK